MISRTFWIVLVLLPLLLYSRAAAALDQDALASLPNVRFPHAGRIASGAIDADDVRALAAAGVRHVIDLRTDAERGEFDEGAAVRAAGMTYTSIPIAGAQSLTRENAVALHEALARAGDEPVLVHCSSGNRVGALIALREAWIRGAAPEEALAEGERWGLANLRDVVAGRIGQQTKQ